MFDFHLTVLSEMLKVGPWCRLPLTIRWLEYEFSKNYRGHIFPPLHMPICYGKVTSCRVKQTQKTRANNVLSNVITKESSLFCSLCGSSIMEVDSVNCVQPNCPLIAHLICLAKLFCKDGMILPIEGICPACGNNVLWGDLIRKKNGCYQDLLETNTDSSSSDDPSLSTRRYNLY